MSHCIHTYAKTLVQAAKYFFKASVRNSPNVGGTGAFFVCFKHFRATVLLLDNLAKIENITVKLTQYYL